MTYHKLVLTQWWQNWAPDEICTQADPNDNARGQLCWTDHGQYPSVSLLSGVCPSVARGGGRSAAWRHGCSWVKHQEKQNYLLVQWEIKWKHLLILQLCLRSWNHGRYGQPVIRTLFYGFQNWFYMFLWIIHGRVCPWAPPVGEVGVHAGTWAASSRSRTCYHVVMQKDRLCATPGYTRCAQLILQVWVQWGSSGHQLVQVFFCACPVEAESHGCVVLKEEIPAGAGCFFCPSPIHPTAHSSAELAPSKVPACQGPNPTPMVLALSLLALFHLSAQGWVQVRCVCEDI